MMKSRLKKGIWSLAVLLVVGFGNTDCRPDSEKGIRIAVATFSHETCTFCPHPTTKEDWEFWGPPTRDILDSDHGYIGGFKTLCEEHDGIELVGILSPRSARGGSSGSWITLEAFDKYADGIVRDIERRGPFDGVFLALHGAMAVTGIPKPEAELIRRIRGVVGGIPVMVTLDLHANEDHELAEAADAVFIIKRYPHYDTTLMGERAARVMLNTIRGAYRPVMASRKPGVITPSVFQGTGVSPAMEIMERARRWECRFPGVYVSVAFGFAYADVPDVGATVMVVTDGDRELAERIAQDMSDYIWRMREVFAGRKLPAAQEGVERAVEAARAGLTPVVIADHSDRTGGATHILYELMHQGAENFCVATLRDEKNVAMLQAEHRPGDSIHIRVGGYSDSFSGDPVEISGTLESMGEYAREPAAVIRFGAGNRVILTPQLQQITSTDIFVELGVPFEELDIIVLKSRVHFRRGYDENGLAGAIFEIDAPGLGPADLLKLPYKNIPGNIYPLSPHDE